MVGQQEGALREGGVAPRSERDRYAALAFCWADLLMHLDGDGNIQFAAGAFKAFTGRVPSDLAGLHFLTLFVPEDVPLVLQCFKQALGRGRVAGEIVRLCRPEGTPLPMDLSAYALDGQCYVALRMRARTPGVANDRATRDPRSGLLTPEAFSEGVGQRARVLRDAGRPVDMTVLDLSGFQGLRERLDDARTGGLMRSVGDSLRAAAVDENSAAQISENCYGLLHDAGLDIEALKDQLQTLTRTHDPQGEGVRVESTKIRLDGVEALGEEDIARGILYAMSHLSRDEGTHALRDLPATITEMVSRATSDVAGFKRLVSQRRFNVVFQPIISVVTGTIHHYEALCRFEASSPEESPYRMITFAEETGLIHEFDLAMAHKVVDWLASKPRNSDAYQVAVNISGYSIGVDAYVQGLLALLRAHPWTRGRLMFEITESSRMADLDGANRFIQTLRDLHYHVCLDDFGAGAASFQYLSALEVDVVKIDGSAVRNAMKVAKGKAFLTALTELCRRLGVHTIAEMVDSPECLRFVRDCGCDYVQGFLFGRPSSNVKDFSPLPRAELFYKQGRRPTITTSVPLVPTATPHA